MKTHKTGSAYEIFQHGLYCCSVKINDPQLAARLRYANIPELYKGTVDDTFYFIPDEINKSAPHASAKRFFSRALALAGVDFRYLEELKKASCDPG
ncbi:hypothetical protein ACFL6Y_08000 [Elusimicrobiota bacterium]